MNDLVGALERLGVVEEMEEEEEDDEDGEESADEEQRLVRQAEEMFVLWLFLNLFFTKFVTLKIVTLTLKIA